MKEKPTNDHICVLKTGKLYEHDIASNALEENNIPSFKQVETSSGLRLAMPFQPAMGPGTYYKIFVPERFAEKATKILKELPIDVTVNPDIWHFSSNGRVKKYWKLLVWFVLSCSFIAIFLNLIKNVR
ncbi:MAG: hypothetical protein SWE60_09465 [Thermodesulfobacteriota bacterium]|nr:hypothetical protein [Thermodesulfobacteriota bacterium]